MCQTLGTQMPVSGGFWFYGDDRYQTDKPTASFTHSPVEHSRIKRCTRLLHTLTGLLTLNVPCLWPEL